MHNLCAQPVAMRRKIRDNWIQIFMRLPGGPPEEGSVELHHRAEDELWMREAIAEARKAEAIGEVPIGAVVVRDGLVIGRGHNRRELLLDCTAHAEMLAIREASESIGAWRLLDCTLYVTLEPCPMCAGAIVQGRVKRVVYGTPDPKAGCAGTLMNLLQEPRFNHEAELTSGVLQTECAGLLTEFFRKLRRQKKSAT